MASKGNLLKALHILKDQRRDINRTLSNEPINQQAKKLTVALLDDIKSDNAHSVWEAPGQLYQHRLSTENSNSITAEDNVGEAIRLIEEKIGI